MGWSRGTEVMESLVECYENIHGNDDHEAKMEFYRAVVSTLQDFDWDTEYEVEGLSPSLDAVLVEKGLLLREEED